LHFDLHLQIEEDLTRGSAAIACRRFSGTHSYDRIAEVLETIHSDLGISYRKIVATVTDNASNFVKCFKEFGFTCPDLDGEDQQPDQTQEESEDMDADEEEVSLIEFPDSPDEHTTKLPNHLRCASHTLNLVATTDAAKGLKAPGLSKINHATMGKCSALWAAAGKPKSAEIVKRVIGKQLRYPCPTRWNSMYDSVLQIQQLGKKVNNLMQELKLPAFKENELEFMGEYLLVMKPIAVALDKLQGEQNCYYGCVIPTLLVINDQLSDLTNDELNELRLRYCMPLLNAVVSGYERRFQKFLDLDPEITDSILACVSHPYFKLRWVPLLKGRNAEDLKAELQNTLQTAVRKFAATVVESEEKGSESPDDDFYKSLEGSSKTPHNTEDLEVLNYFQDTSKSLSCLERYPSVRRIFMRYNTALPSSAAVERLFSFAGMVHNPKRTRLSDAKFEQLVLLKANGKHVF
jgi:hypothetical protein